MRILVAENKPVSAQSLQEVLQSIGYNVISASNIEQAWECLQDENIQIVVSAWDTDFDGLELCQRIRNKETANYVYTILLPSYSVINNLNDALDVGVDDFLKLPLDKEELLIRLKVASRILAIRTEIQENSEHLRLTKDHLAAINSLNNQPTRRFQELFENLPIACHTFDKHGKIYEWNRESEKLFGVPSQLAFQKKVNDLFNQQASKAILKKSHSRVFAGQLFNGLEWTYQHPEGRNLYLLSYIFPQRRGDGEIIGAVCTTIDITERKALEQQTEQQKHELEIANTKLKTLATLDGLTGLYNHRAFQERLEEEMLYSLRQNIPMSLAMIDVDKFKDFNDTFGHPLGDEALQNVARLLEENIQAGDFVARYGGEEFAVIMRNANLDGSLILAERIRAGIETAPWKQRGVTVSIGVSTVTPAIASRADLIDQADKSLYMSKRNGRNRITHAAELPANKALKPAS